MQKQGKIHAWRPPPYQQKTTSEMRCQKPIDHRQMISLINFKISAKLHKQKHSNVRETKEGHDGKYLHNTATKSHKLGMQWNNQAKGQ